MRIDINKLEKVNQGKEGKTLARCPACAKMGNDKKGEHLVIYPSGKFGCATHTGDAEHRRRIMALAGAKAPANNSKRITVQPLDIPPVRVLKRIKFADPRRSDEGRTTIDLYQVVKTCPKCPDSSSPQIDSTNVQAATLEQAMAFVGGTFEATHSRSGGA